MKKKVVDKWFEPGKPLGWSKDDGQAKRREAALKARKGDYLKTGRALQALSNVTQDPETKKKAYSDAQYFFAKHRNELKKKGK